MQFFGDEHAEELYDGALDKLKSVGGEAVEIDFSIFRCAAELLYSGPWVAERLAAIGDFLRSEGDGMDPVVRKIISSGERFTAVDAFRADYQLRELCRRASEQWAAMDVMVLPTTGTIYTHKQIAAAPIQTNTNLGYYTNFVNLMDLAAVATPGGFRSNGLPFGISFVGPAFSDDSLLTLAERFLGETRSAEVAQGCVAVAVVGAHLSGQPLNWQLTERRSSLLKTCRTAPDYRLYALNGTQPAKPGLVRDCQFKGPGIEVEVWAVPEDEFGRFVAAVPAPLGIGNATMDSGESVKCFICEPYGIAGATEITHFGGWRTYLASLKA